MDRRRRPTAPEVAATWLIVACAVILTSTVLWREFGASSVGTTRIAQAGLQAGSSVDDWEQFAEGGISLGSADAPVTIIEFADFKCGFCRDLAPILKEVRSEYGARIRLIYRHFPGASGHPEAEAAAMAGECAARFDVFETFHDELFDRPELAGTGAYAALFENVGGREVVEYSECMESSWVRDRVAADMEAVALLGVSGTPTLLINGRVVVGLVSREALIELVEEALNG
ncbi:DsbA family protein [Candidatus Palauibacter sp.]|uniref:DsbA family protein n=1 Tax=Candidatus Palauibacter sp. TaxID=3101350 RepID=UPI003B5A12A5